MNLFRVLKSIHSADAPLLGVWASIPLYPLDFCRTWGEKLYGVEQDEMGEISNFFD